MYLKWGEIWTRMNNYSVHDLFNYSFNKNQARMQIRVSNSPVGFTRISTGPLVFLKVFLKTCVIQVLPSLPHPEGMSGPPDHPEAAQGSETTQTLLDCKC
ncbi:hypothetical protein ATANTOWER_003850, partial [Ataeniobius toweri]|nr:hypothetical protein [Ataeniobius toweri]